MQLGRCPSCHARIDLQGLVQDQASSELMSLLARQPKDVSRPLVEYLALFRPAKQDLSMARAVKLTKEVLALQGPLGSALEKTVQNIAAQRAGRTDNKPLANHNYLKQVLDTLGSPVKKPGYQKPPGQVEGETHKATEMKKEPSNRASGLMKGGR